VVGDLADHPYRRVQYYRVVGTQQDVGGHEFSFFKEDAVDSCSYLQSFPGADSLVVERYNGIEEGPGDRRRHFCRKALEMIELVDYVLAAEDGIIISEQLANDAAQELLSTADTELAFPLDGSSCDADLGEDDEDVVGEEDWSL